MMENGKVTVQGVTTPVPGEAEVALPVSAGANHSTPESKQTSTSQHGQDTKYGVQSKRKNNRKKTKSANDIWKARYSRAKFVLAKIDKNALNGTVHERDEEDRVRCQAVVDEYLKYKATLPNTSVVSVKKNEGAKRNRSQTEGGTAPKRTKVTEQKTVPRPISSASRRPLSEVVKDHLLLALANVTCGLPSPVVTEWGAIESKLSELVMEYVFSNVGGPVPRFDSSEIHRGYRLIKCMDVFSKDFLGNCVAKISDAWENLSLKLIPAAEVPLRPRARVWFPKMTMDSNKLLRGLKLMNPEVPMNDWTVVPSKDPQNPNFTTVVFSISELGASALENTGYKLFFGVRETKVKVFRPSGSKGADDAEKFDSANQLPTQGQLEEPSIMANTENDVETKVMSFCPSGSKGADDTDKVDPANQLSTRMQLSEPPIIEKTDKDVETKAKDFHPSGSIGADEKDNVVSVSQLLTQRQQCEPITNTKIRNDAKGRAD